MKMLILIRHAKSSWEDPYQADFDRPLNKRGNRDAPRMGKRLKAKEIHADLMLSSPAERALSTCKIIAEVIGYKKEKISTDRKLYHANDDQILSVIHKLNDKLDKVIIFGHNPGLTDFANRLGGASEAIDNLPTCAVVAFNLPVDSWKKVEWEKGEVEFFDYPKSN